MSLAVQHLSVLDLLDPSQGEQARFHPAAQQRRISERHHLIAQAPVAATHPLLTSMHVKEILKFKKSFLKTLKPEIEGSLCPPGPFVYQSPTPARVCNAYPRLLPRYPAH